MIYTNRLGVPYPPKMQQILRDLEKEIEPIAFAFARKLILQVLDHPLEDIETINEELSEDPEYEAWLLTIDKEVVPC